MAREYPTNTDALRMFGGMGEKKLAEFGNIFTNEVAAYLRTYPKVDFSERAE
jgi:hypothetical protein